MAPTREKRPNPNSASPAGSTQSASTPTEALTPTAGEASAFMTTTLHWPVWTSHSRLWRLLPLACATQKLSSPGGRAGAPPSA